MLGQCNILKGGKRSQKDEEKYVGNAYFSPDRSNGEEVVP